MKKKYQILKVRDKADNYGTKKENIFDIPFRVLLTAKSGSGKTTLITNFLLNPNFYLKDFKGDDIYIISPSLNNDEKISIIAEEKEIPECNLMTDYDESLVKAIYDMLEEDLQHERTTTESNAIMAQLPDDDDFGDMDGDEGF